MLAPRDKLWPASPALVEASLDLLGVRAGDVLWDLGSGDGVALFAAAARGARAVGFEIVAARAAASRAAAAARGLGAAVAVVTGNALDADPRAAPPSKVYLYLIARGLRLVLPLLRRAAAARGAPLDVLTVLYAFEAGAPGVALVERRKVALSATNETPIYLWRVSAEEGGGAGGEAGGEVGGGAGGGVGGGAGGSADGGADGGAGGTPT
jgi:hypothetical protein